MTPEQARAAAQEILSKFGKVHDHWAEVCAAIILKHALSDSQREAPRPQPDERAYCVCPAPKQPTQPYSAVCKICKKEILGTGEAGVPPTPDEPRSSQQDAEVVPREKDTEAERQAAIDREPVPVKAGYSPEQIALDELKAAHDESEYLTDPLALAVLFHATYERLAPNSGYETRKETRIFDPESPNGKLMLATCAEVQKAIRALRYSGELRYICTCRAAQPDPRDERLRELERQDWRKMCIVEIAAENPSVSDYVKHWEGRAEAAEAERDRLVVIEENLADYAKRFVELFDMYRNAWLREMGGVIVPKHHVIDGFVLRARDIYEKAQLVDRIKRIMVTKVKAKKKCTGVELFDEVFKFLAEDRHDQIPTN